MSKKRRKFEQEVLERLESIEQTLQSLTPPSLPQESPQHMLYGYTCTCGVWVQFGQAHVCQYLYGTNTCESDSSKTPDLKVV
jgi:hypothetical protein